MRKILAMAAAAATILSASAANAASLLFQFGGDSYVDVLENNTLCLGSCAMSATLAILPTSLEIEEGQSATFAFANFHVNSGLGFGNAVVDAYLALTSPMLDGAGTGGSGVYARAGTRRFPGLLIGALNWNDPQHYFSSNGSAFSVTFNDIAGFTNGGNATGTVTIHVDSVGAIPEPATWALMIGGFGMAGATLRRRRAIAA